MAAAIPQRAVPALPDIARAFILILRDLPVRFSLELRVLDYQIGGRTIVTAIDTSRPTQNGNVRVRASANTTAYEVTDGWVRHRQQ
jgi:hypothetical protein